MKFFIKFRFCKIFCILLVLSLKKAVNGNLIVETQILDRYSSYNKTFVQLYDSTGKHIFSTYDNQTQCHLRHIYVEFVLENHKLTLDLQKNDFLFTPGYMERTSSSLLPSNYTSRNCYYIGALLNDDRQLIPNVHVAVSTCKGLRGCVMLENDTINIEPATEDINDVHYFFRDSSRLRKTHHFNHSKLVVDDDDVSDDPHAMMKKKKYNPHRTHRLKKRSKNRPYDSNNETLIVELYVANDQAQFIRQGSNVQATIDRTKDAVNIVNSIYRQLNVYIVLIGVEVWNDIDRIQTTNDPQNLLNNFLKYREDFLNSWTPNDNAQLITGRNLGDGILGKAPVMTMCTWSKSGAINVDHSLDVARLAATMAHEIGHNFGLEHDDSVKEVTCPDEKCIMGPQSSEFIPARFSSNSKMVFKDLLDEGMRHCLQNSPHKVFGEGNDCGNGFINKGEDCDCGLPKDCTSKCCDPRTCKFLSRATCATGSCCNLDTCQIKPPMTECRGVQSECDVGEYCDGESEFCPFDVFKHNGHPCTSFQKGAFCFDGQCRTHDTQCKRLYGVTGQQSASMCYEQFNIDGSLRGNCGYKWEETKSYIKCNNSDVMCGLLHCQHSSEKMMFWDKTVSKDIIENIIFIQPGNIRYDCKTVMLDIDKDADNPGLVPNGASCGSNKMCMSQRCVDAREFVESLNCPECHNHGVCTNIGQCHCDVGYAPPHCDRSGFGGSLHSNAISDKSKVGALVGVSIFVFIIFPCILIIAILLYKRKHLIMKRLGLGKYRSVSRPTLPPRGEPVTNTYPRPPPPSYPQLAPPPPLPSGPPPFTTVPLMSSHSFSRPPNSTKPLVNKLQSSKSFSQTSRTKPSIEMVHGNFVRPQPPVRPSRLPASTARSDEDTEVVGANDAGDLRSALTKLQELDFLNPKYTQRHHRETRLPRISKSDDDDESNHDYDHQNRKHVPFRKAPPPPPQVKDTDMSEDEDCKQNYQKASQAAKRQPSISKKPSFRPPPPPKPKPI
ncbi:hypothetical protein HELRODRAFT_96397 [Helobdella robusta]|uniref:Peptidase M12B domain-containing protein n=1 Tax=Helobdella robusta TaxID=6412 RepID=T1G9B8_HELRO|nr:hypothetical protein HELRODRAFT_96397 [Helobdella robusta]ESN91736.1 hypothetical protein HELRODRAFT_96397 [Helobdella robusta]